MSNEPSTEGPAVVLRIAHYENDRDLREAVGAAGDMTSGHDVHLRVGWTRDPSGDLVADACLVGGATAAQIRAAAECLIGIGVRLHGGAEEIDASLVDQRFDNIIAGSAAGIEGSDAEVTTCPGWAGMTGLDRALAVNYIERTVNGDQGLTLRYAHDEALRQLDAGMAHQHAMHLAEQMSLPGSLTDHERARLRELSDWFFEHTPTKEA